MDINKEELQLIHFSHPVMRIKPPVFDFQQDGESAKDLAKAVYEKMLELKGAGLSANQIGLPYRMFVMGNENSYIAFFNPTVLGVSKDENLFEESCITEPDFFLTLRRPEKVYIEYQDEEGTVHNKSFEGVPARVILHEYDHMEGLNFTDHASNFKLKYSIDRWKKRRKKLQRRMKNGK